MKFSEHADLRAALLAAGDEEIVQGSPRDSYWSIGRDNTGKNMLTAY